MLCHFIIAIKCCAQATATPSRLLALLQVVFMTLLGANNGGSSHKLVRQCHKTHPFGLCLEHGNTLGTQLLAKSQTRIEPK